jgi:hypothetical protein
MFTAQIRAIMMIFLIRVIQLIDQDRHAHILGPQYLLILSITFAALIMQIYWDLHTYKSESPYSYIDHHTYRSGSSCLLYSSRSSLV